VKLSELWRRVRFLAKGQRMAQELEEEMSLHIELRAQALRGQDKSAEEAEAAARRKFGNRTLLKETSQKVWAFVAMETLWRELKIAARTLRRSPGFAMTAVLTLGLGIGANTAVFSLVDATLLRPLPYSAADRLGQVVIDYKTPGEQGIFPDVDGRTWELLREHADALECAVYSDTTAEVNLGSAGRVGYVRQQRVSAGYFRVLGIHPELGREFTRSEDSESGQPVAILSYGVWRNIFGADRTIIGRSILLRGQRYTVAGVMPVKLRTSNRADVWTPLHPSTKGEGADKNYMMIGRVKPGATWQKAMLQVEALGARRLSEEHDIPANYKLRIVLLPLQQTLALGVRSPVLLLWCAVIVVLLIGCINIAGLLIARGAGRTREIGTRMALGGGQAQVMRQLLIESLLLSVMAGVAGLVIGWAGIAATRAVGPESLGLWQAIEMDHRVLLASGMVTFLTTVLFGGWPALRSSRVDIRTALSQGGSRAVAGSRALWPGRLLIVSEVALGLMLLVAAGLVVRSFLYLRNQPLGFDPDNVVAATLPLQDVRYQTSAKVNRLFNDALLQIGSAPGVESVAAGMCLPYERGLNTMAKVPGGKAQDTVLSYVTPEYFRTLRIPILRGRSFSVQEDMHGARVGIVNAVFARKYFGAVDPVGRSVNQGGGPVQIIGVIPDVPMKGSLEGYAPVTAIPMIFVPAAQISDGMYQLMNAWFTPSFVVRSSAERSDLIAGMQRAMGSVDPLLPFSGFHGIIDIRSDTLAQQRFQAAVMSILGGVALLLAAIGIYGLIAYSVVERTRELGIRMAVGATVRQAIQSVALPGFILALAGTAIGVIASYGAVPLLRHMIWGVRPVDSGTFAGMVAMLLAVAAAAILIPSLRIVRLNPADTLRQE